MVSHSLLLQAIETHAKSQPNKTAFIVDNQRISYKELYRNICKAARTLISWQVKAGDTIILSAQKNIEFIYFYFGAQMCGIINTILDASSNENRTRYIEEKVHPKICLGYISPNYPSKLFSEIKLDDAEYRDCLSNDSVSSDDTAEIIFTTGTTGAPKGVLLSYKNISSSANNINGYIQNTTDDIELLALPICHSFGLGRIRCTVINGATIILLGGFANVRLFLKAIETYHVTGFGVVPAAWAYIRKISGTRITKYAKQIKYIEIGSSSMPLSTKREMLSFFPETRICMHYGLTEASRSTFLEFHDESHIDSIGKAVSSEVELVVMDSEGRLCPDNVSGELCVKGNMVVKSYLDEHDNSHAFWGDYFRTGDCAFRSSDGYFYYVGRDKELINVGGKKVSPVEVEEAICSLGVGDCMVVGREDKDGIMGEMVKAYILKGSTDLSFNEISQRLSLVLEHYKLPSVYEWIDEIPTTQSGKKQRLSYLINDYNVISIN